MPFACVHRLGRWTVAAAALLLFVATVARAAYERAMKAVADGRAADALGELKSAVAFIRSTRVR